MTKKPALITAVHGLVTKMVEEDQAATKRDGLLKLAGFHPRIHNE